MAIKIYTKTKHHLSKQHKYIPRMYGVIEGPVHQMLKHFPNEFVFIRHESKRSLRPSAKEKKNKEILMKGGKI
tara:strand:- start:44 stop:262 length:219 start_codon:yes stop_codon:yes gene_type:complete